MNANSFFVIRHGLTDHNVFKRQLLDSQEYTDFNQSFLQNPNSINTKTKAIALLQKHKYDTKDEDIPLHNDGVNNIESTAKKLVLQEGMPDLILCSPYLRARQTLAIMQKSVPKLVGAETIFDYEIREQFFGDIHYYATHNIYFAHYNDEHKKFLQLGLLEYACPNGESVNSMTSDRIANFIDNKIYGSEHKTVWVICHYSTLLAFRKILENLTDNEYNHYNSVDTPKNCGVTKYALDANNYKCVWYNKCYY